MDHDRRTFLKTTSLVGMAAMTGATLATDAAAQTSPRTGGPTELPKGMTFATLRRPDGVGGGFGLGLRTDRGILDVIAADGAAEIVHAFALPLPVRVITRILGFPDSDVPKLKDWSAAWVLPFAGDLTEAQEVWVAEQVVQFQHYIAEHIAQKRSNPGDDVLTALTQASFAGKRRLTDHEIITMADHLFIGGNETTTFAITSALWIMLREPGLYELLRDRRELVDVFVE